MMEADQATTLAELDSRIARLASEMKAALIERRDLAAAIAHARSAEYLAKSRERQRLFVVRQARIFEMAKQGMTYAEIAEREGIGKARIAQLVNCERRRRR